MERMVTQVFNHIFSAVGALVVSGIVGAGGWLWGNLTIAHILVLGIVALVLMLCGRLAWAKVRELRYRPAEFGDWDKVMMPALWQAACLWDGYNPYSPVDETTPSYPTLQMLKSAVMEGSLNPHEFGKSDMWVRVKRVELRAYAEGRGVRPLFLFPEDREGSSRQ